MAIVRFVLLMLGLFIMASGGTFLYIALVAEFFWVEAFRRIDNIPLGCVAACFIYSGWMLTRNMIEDDLEAAD